MTEQIKTIQQGKQTIVVAARIDKELHQRMFEVCSQLGYRKIAHLIEQAIIEKVNAAEQVEATIQTA